MNPMHDGPLVAAFLQNERQFRQIAARKFRLDYDDVQDLMQITLIAAARIDAKTFQPEDPPAYVHWLFKQCHTAFTRMKRRSLHIRNALQLEPPSNAVVHIKENSERQRMVIRTLAAIAKLGTLLQDSIIARRILGLNTTETCQLLDCSVRATMKTRLRRAEDALRGAPQDSLLEYLAVAPPPPPGGGRIELSVLQAAVSKMRQTPKLASHAQEIFYAKKTLERAEMLASTAKSRGIRMGDPLTLWYKVLSQG